MDANLNSNIPNPLASRKEKSSEAYMLSYAKFIWSQFMRINPLFNEKLQRLRNNRKYAAGLQSITDVRTLMGSENSAYLNLDIQPVNRIAKNFNIIVSTLMEQEYFIDCEPLDPESKLIEEGERDKIIAEMWLKKNTKELEEVSGISLYSKSKQLPENEDELDMYFALNGKMGVSLAMEQAMRYVLSNNSYDTYVKEKLLRDLVAINACATHRYYDNSMNIKCEYIDFADLIYPYSKYDDFRDIPYVAVKKKMSLLDIAQNAVNPDGSPRFTEEQLRNIAMQFEGRNSNPAWNSGWSMSYDGYYASATTIRPYYDYTVDVMQFYFIGESKEYLVKTKKNGKEYLDYKNKYEESPNKELVTAKYRKWLYEGCWIVGTDYVYNYKEVDNQERPKTLAGYSPDVELPIEIIAPNIYDMENKSIVEMAIQGENQLNLIEQKIQQFLIKAAPKGWAINQAALEEIKAGKGNDQSMTPDEQYSMWTQTGSMVYYAKDQAGNPLSAQPIYPLDNGFGQGFADLLKARAMEMQKIDDVMGLNEAMNASSINPETPVGSQQIAMAATIKSLMPLYRAFINVTERTCQGLALMIQDTIENNDEAFIKAIGKAATDNIEMFKKLPLATMGITIAASHSKEEQQMIYNFLNLDIQNQVISTADAIKVLKVIPKSPDLAASILNKIEKKRKEEKAKESAMLQKQNGDIQMQSVQAASQAKLQEIQAETQAKIALEQAILEGKKQLVAFESERDIELQKLKNEGLAIQASINNQGKVSVQQAANEGKVVTEQIKHEANLSHTAFAEAIKPKETKDMKGNS